MVLREMGVYVDDRRSRLDANLQAKLHGLAGGLAAETEQWIRGLVDGGPRRAPRSSQTALRYLHSVQPALLAWSQRYSTLREVTHDDVLTHLQPLTGNTRQATLVALRSLFGAAKKNGVIFRDPTSRIRVGAAVGSVLQTLPTWTATSRKPSPPAPIPAT